MGARAELGDLRNLTHKIRPGIAGGHGRYMLTYVAAPNTGGAASLGDHIHVQRFDWDATPASRPRSQPTLTMAREAVAGRMALSHGGSNSIAYDNTRSHWAVLYNDYFDTYVARLGPQGGRVETVLVRDQIAGPGGICYNDADYEFAVAYNELTAPSYPIVGTRLQYLAGPATTYGTGCGSVIRAVNQGPRDHPFAGSDHFGIQLQYGHANTPTALIAGFAPASVPMFGSCTLNIDPTAVFTMTIGASDGAGGMYYPMPLPDRITNLDVRWQWLQLYTGVVVTTHGLLTQIR